MKTYVEREWIKIPVKPETGERLRRECLQAHIDRRANFGDTAALVVELGLKALARGNFVAHSGRSVGGW